MASPWPVYETLSEARCHNCEGPLYWIQQSGYPQGNGEFKGKCALCGLQTWFDFGS